ncbi:hypothetical protein CKO44_06795 [Rubrivivax gelatinosus]|uniref:hypothetical protein n=1 Tax=Rubrivivax gelatinosus TaxID=28068 RepID=UPI001904F85C|nr:hypothetical protein [Rubrivivax gelatinosus]MBK1613180.1 hypothetical protein [Rubrivivax gelatinosus]MBZ8143111.1 hypothetical protein [Rubrivivax gelatinosus]
MTSDVAATIAARYQRKQLDALKAQAHHEEMQRTIASLGQALDATLALPPPDIAFKAIDFRPATLGLLLSTLAPIKVFAGTANWMAWAEAKDATQYTREQVAADLKHLIPMTNAAVRDLESMAWCLLRLREAGGNSDVLRYYQRRYIYVSRDLSTLGLLPAASDIHAFYCDHDE